MPLLDILTTAIAGPGTVRRSQERAVERYYQCRERGSLDIGIDSPACTNTAPGSASLDQPSLATYRRHENGSIVQGAPHSSRRAQRSTAVRPVVQLQRSQSAQPALAEAAQSPAGPPDITTIQLSAEQLKRTYSHDNVWDSSKTPLPPLPQMKGFGKYRTAVDADSVWHASNLRRQLSGMVGLVPHDSIATMSGLTFEQLSEMDDDLCRQASIVSSKSVHSTSSGAISELYIDVKTGTRISRGFSPSASFSTQGSLRDRNDGSRKNSGLSLKTTVVDTVQMSAQHPQRQETATSNDHEQPEVFIINDKQRTTNHVPLKKVGRVCEFTEGGNPESAVVSDAEDGSGYESWEDMPGNVEEQLLKSEFHVNKQKETGFDLARGLTELRNKSSKSKVMHRNSELDRSRLIRTPSGQAPGASSKVKVLRPCKNRHFSGNSQKELLKTQPSNDASASRVMTSRRCSSDGENCIIPNTAASQPTTSSTEFHAAAQVPTAIGYEEGHLGHERYQSSMLEGSC